MSNPKIGSERGRPSWRALRTGALPVLMALAATGVAEAAAAQVIDTGREGAGADAVMYLEGGGNAIFGSLNMELALTRSVFARVGISLLPGFPFMLTYLAGDGPHHLEASAGMLLEGFGLNGRGTATLGYRYQRPGGLLFRIGITPLLGDGVPSRAGVSLGFALEDL